MNIIENKVDYEKKFDNFTIKTIDGDITKEKVDAIIVPIDSMYTEKHPYKFEPKKAIIELENKKAFDNFNKIIKEKTLYPAQNIITDSYMKNCKKIIYSAIDFYKKGYYVKPDFRNDPIIQMPMLRATVNNAILNGYKLGLKSFAFPFFDLKGINYEIPNGIILGFIDAINEIGFDKDEEISFSVVFDPMKMSLSLFNEELRNYELKNYIIPNIGSYKGITDIRWSRWNEEPGIFNVNSTEYNSTINKCSEEWLTVSKKDLDTILKNYINSNLANQR